MKSFGDWFRDFSIEPETHENGFCEDDFRIGTEGFEYPCRRCEEYSPIHCEIEEFDPDHHYCGRDQYCTP